MPEVRQQISEVKPFNVITTFAGCGGSSRGYAMAGGRVLVASEWDKNACAVYRLNHPGTDLIEGDICKDKLAGGVGGRGAVQAADVVN